MKGRWLLSAPAPLDVGAARLALFTDLLAARDRAAVTLRIDDDGGTDTGLTEIDADLAWLGIDVAGERVRTSARADRYRTALRGLHERGRTQDAADAIVLRVPPGHTQVDDALRGPVIFDNAQLGEIVVARGKEVSADLAAAIDRSELGPPIVVRDDRQLPATARELLVLAALELPAPRYAHVGALLPANAEAALPTIAELRRAGFLPAVVAAYLRRPDHVAFEEATRTERAAAFELERLAHGPAHFDPAGLRAANAEALRALPRDGLAALIAASMQRNGFLEDPIPPAAQRWIETFLDAYGTEFATLGEALVMVADLRAESVIVPALELERLRNRQVVFFLDGVGQYVDAQPELRGLPLDHDLPAIGAEFGIGHDDAFAAVRMALTGMSHGPPLGLLFPLLGHDRILIRIGAISSHLLHGRGLEPIKYGPGGVPFETIVPGGPPDEAPPV